MTVIEVNFLTGRYSATAHDDRERPEWPPHGARLFSAMVAVWAEAEAPDDDERRALEWLEAQPSPRITAPEAVPRRVVSHFVPVNDANVIGPSAYQRRAEEVQELIAQWEDQLDGSRGEITRSVQRLQDKIDKQRDVESLVVPVGNTNTASAVALLPDGRVKKERYFPSVTLVNPGACDAESNPDQSRLETDRIPRVLYAWDETTPPGVTGALDALLGRVTRLGHSSSLVSCRLSDEVPAPTHLPGEGAQILRWVRPEQLSVLEKEYLRHRAVRPRSLPFRGIRYRETSEAVVEAEKPLISTVAGDWIVFELAPHCRRMPMTRTVELTRVLRECLLSRAADPLPEGLSGHLPDGRPTTDPHIAFLALPNVGYEHSDGRIMGLAISMPHGLDDAARNSALSGIGAWERAREKNGFARPLKLKLGRNGVVKMTRRQPPFALVSLRREMWQRRSKWWVSATPIALPTHPGDLRRGKPATRARAWARAEEAVARSCEHVGLPRPTDVRVSLVSQLAGTRPVQHFPSFKQGRDGAGVTRRLLHAAVAFAEDVQGPLMLGSGRFLGLGLMRPATDISAADVTNRRANDE